MKPYVLEFTLQSEREFLSLPKNIQEKIKQKMEFFIHTGNPMHFSKKLRDSIDKYRFRIGDYRVIVQPQDRRILVILVILKIGHRREIYE